MAESDSANPRVRDEHRRTSDKLWDWGLRLLSALLTAMAVIVWGKVDGAEKRIQTLEIRNAVLEAGQVSTSEVFKEIKIDIREIKNKLEMRRTP